MAKGESLTQGSVTAELLTFAVPIFISQLLQQLYNIVDTVIVGRYLGLEAFAGIGATWALNYIVLSFCSGIGLGIGIPIAQCRGAEDMESLRRYFWNGLYVAVFFSILVTSVSLLGCGSFLRWSHIDDTLFYYAYHFIFLIFAGIPFTIFYNLSFGVMMAFGNSRYPSVVLGCTIVINLVLDFVFILGMDMGVSGAALATTTANAVAACVCFVHMMKHYPQLYGDCRERSFRWNITSDILKVSIPMGLQSSITAIGAVILQTSINDLGETAIAAYSAGAKIKGLFLCPVQALGNALSTFVGQNFGAGNWKRIRKGVRTAIGLGMVYSTIIAVCGTLFGRNMAGIFLTGEQTEALVRTAQFIGYMGFFVYILAVLFPVRYATQGMGYSRYSIFSGAAEMLARVIAGIWFVPRYGFIAVCLSEGATFMCGVLVIVPLYFHIIRAKSGYYE